MESQDRNFLSAKVLLVVAISCAALAAAYGGSYAQFAHGASGVELGPLAASPSPTPVATPSLLMEGRGQISPSTKPCTSTSCPGTFTAMLSGRPFGKSDLVLNLSVDRTADAFTGCRRVTATGSLKSNGFTVNFVGQLCAPGVGYLLSGAVQIYTATGATDTAATGTLVAFGGTNTPPNPVPSSGPSLVTLIGASGKIPVLIP